jgi:hypothetical protein
MIANKSSCLISYSRIKIKKFVKLSYKKFVQKFPRFNYNLSYKIFWINFPYFNQNHSYILQYEGLLTLLILLLNFFYFT